ncbi:DUF58 domain-containing protein [Streptomyces sp. TP-A0874]|uniref:DUF58 domain-containing protein n=1 Tax=Streptomyces sp. TP-A0874 TaxID=549819 RepID=UPI0009A04529|nr:DUF58 domain-containing protein [Streptomyces sp. TP-A0874]
MPAAGPDPHPAAPGAAFAPEAAPGRTADPAGRLAEPGAEAGRAGLGAAFAGLTTRGRSFLAAGLAAGGCSFALGEADLLRVGLLLAVLPLVCVVVLYRTRHRVTGVRTVSPTRVTALSESRVWLRISNASRLPTGLMLIQDQVPYVLGARPRFVLDRVEPGGLREVSYRVRSDLRGCYPLGPLQLWVADPFGMCELARPFTVQDTLTVVPRVDPLPPARLSGDAAGYGDGRRASLALAGEEDVIPRDYRHGDDLRRVHWRSTARYGELMVRREEQPRRARCTVLLDTRSAGYRGSGPDSAFEWAVSGAASVLSHMLERGFSVRLLTDTGLSVPGQGSSGFSSDSPEVAALLLDSLAVLDHSAEPSLSRAYDVMLQGGEGLLIAFLGDLDPEQTALVARMGRRSDAAVVFLLDSADWWSEADRSEWSASESLGEERLRPLREAGWTVVPVPPGASLPELWQRADRDAAAGRPKGFAGGVEA